MRFTAAEKRKCAEREVEMRKRVYGERVLAGRMSSGEAERETAMMQEIATDYLDQELGYAAPNNE